MNSQFVWFELASADAPKARRFYEQLFGWEATEAGGYTMIKVAAAAEIGAGIKPSRGASQWAPFVSVADVKAASKKAIELGGKVVDNAHETPNGIVSTVLDPTGAVLNLWQPLAA